MISCDKAGELISAQLDGELTPEEASQLEAHLLQCAPCRALRADYQHLHAALLEAAVHWQVQPPEGLSQRVLEGIQAENLYSMPSKKRRWTRRGWGALAAVLALALIGGGALSQWSGSGAAGGGNGAGSAPLLLAPGGQEEPEAAAALPADCSGGVEAAGMPMPQADEASFYDVPSDGGAKSGGPEPALRSASVEEFSAPSEEDGCSSFPGGIAPVLLVDGVRYFWAGLNFSQSWDTGCQLEEDGRYSFTTMLPAGYELIGAISSVTGEAPEEQLQLQAGFPTSGWVYANDQEPHVLYAYMDSTWFTHSYVRFDSEKLGDSRLICLNASLYRFPVGMEEENTPLLELPEGCVSAGALTFVGEAAVPAANLETNCKSDGYGRLLNGREVFQDPSDPSVIYVYEEQSWAQGSYPAWRLCPLWEGDA